MRGLFEQDIVTNKHMDHWKFTMVRGEGNNLLDVCLLQSNIILIIHSLMRGVVTVRTIAAIVSRRVGDEVRLDTGMEGGH